MTHKTVIKTKGVDTDIWVHFTCTVTFCLLKTHEALTSVNILSRLFMKKKKKTCSANFTKVEVIREQQQKLLLGEIFVFCCDQFYSGVLFPVWSQLKQQTAENRMSRH